MHMNVPDGWITIKGNHVFFENNIITKGPKELIGRDYDQAHDKAKNPKEKKNYIKPGRLKPEDRIPQDIKEEYKKDKNKYTDIWEYIEINHPDKYDDLKGGK